MAELEAAPEPLHHLADVARELGRFEMLVNPARPAVSYVKSELSLAAFRECGFDRAASITVTRGDYGPGLRDATLARLGRKFDGGWILDAPATGATADWRRLLDSDMPIVLEAPADIAWIEQCIAQLHAPALHWNGNMGLNLDALRACQRLLEGGDDKLVVAFGLHRQLVSVFGKGPAFEAALSAMAARPQAWWGLTHQQRRHLLHDGFRLEQAEAWLALPCSVDDGDEDDDE